MTTENRIFGPVPLLQSGELPTAKEIPNPETLDHKGLDKLLEMGQALFETHPNFNAVAFTQFRPDTFLAFGADPAFNRFIMFSPQYQDLYMSPFVLKNGNLTSLAGSILINPKITTSNFVNQQISPEGCGSIKNAAVEMFAVRPSIINMRAWIYNPETGYSVPTPTNPIQGERIALAVYIHEHHHLNGHDATNSPSCQLLDPWGDPNNPSWESKVENWRTYAKSLTKNFLVRRHNQLAIVDSDGNFVEKFRR